MDFWSRMLSGIADTILPKDLEEDALLLQMEEALREEKELWRARQNFLELSEQMAVSILLCKEEKHRHTILPWPVWAKASQPGTAIYRDL